MSPINILIVDDTIVYRSVLRSVVDALPDCVVAGTASNGIDALEALRRISVELVLLDVEMPRMDGLETLSRIRAEFPALKVIMVSAANRSAADITIRALALGALDFIPKPETGDPTTSKAWLIEALGSVISTFRVKHPAPAPVLPTIEIPHPGPPRKHTPSSRVELIAIAVSTGGPVALTTLIPALPDSLGVPVVLVQHMPPVFTESLARNLDRQSPLFVCEGQEGQELLPNAVYIAPGGRHMLLRRSPVSGAVSLGLNENPPENNCRPAADVLFRSVAALYGDRALGVVLTGMGTDGREGARAMRRQGCTILTQDEASCVVYGMPRAVVDAGLSHESVPLERMAARIQELVNTPLVRQP